MFGFGVASVGYCVRGGFVLLALAVLERQLVALCFLASEVEGDAVAAAVTGLFGSTTFICQ